jgi:hypothetical protein
LQTNSDVWQLLQRSVNVRPLIAYCDNHALGMELLLKPVIPRRRWPKPVFKDKRAITTAEEQAAIAVCDTNPERRDSFELLWQTGGFSVAPSRCEQACGIPRSLRRPIADYAYIELQIILDFVRFRQVRSE